MHWVNWLICALYLATLNPLIAASSEGKRKMLLAKIPRRDFARSLALYELYPNTAEGAEALKRAMKQLSHCTQCPPDGWHWQNIPQHALSSMIDLLGRGGGAELPQIQEESLCWIEKLGGRLKNRQLAGHAITSLDELFSIDPSQIDLARGMFLSHIFRGEMEQESLRRYEAILDLIALQVISQSISAESPDHLIEALNRFLFFDMNLRFPPVSEFAKEIDRYTFLPAVLDSHRGVCLGVSVLYACIAQRLGLKVELVTPPGHIYVRYQKAGGGYLNIETTARGVHIDCRDYLGVELDGLKARSELEAIGMVHFNQAGLFWQRGEYERTADEYAHAARFMGNDPTLLMLQGYVEFLCDRSESAVERINLSIQRHREESMPVEPLAEELLSGLCDVEVLTCCYRMVDDGENALREHCSELYALLEQRPKSRALLFACASAEMQRQRYRDALPLLERYHQIDPSYLTVEYFLAAIYSERREYAKVWSHLEGALTTVAERGRCAPQPFVRMQRELMARAPMALWKMKRG